MSEYVLKILDHYKQEDPTGLPGVPIPDPLTVPDLKNNVPGGTMHMKNVSLSGLTNFRLETVKANVAAMEVQTALTFDQLIVKGNYTLSGWLGGSSGPFTVTLTKVFVQANATMEVQLDGKLRAQNMNMDIKLQKINMDFQRLGGLYQSVIKSAGSFVFENVKPYVIKQVNTNVREEVNKQIDALNQTFPNSIAPLDQLLSEVRHKIRKAGYDPYQVKDYDNSAGVFEVRLSNTWAFGLSSIYRCGDILFEIRNKTVYMVVDVCTQRLKGSSNWEVSLLSGILSRSGSVAFTIEYFQVEVALSQSMDTRKHPRLEDIQLRLGNIQIRFDGTGTFDYVVEFAVNVFPNILRFQIMDAIEEPLKIRIQEVLDKVNTESIIKENVKKLDDGQLNLNILPLTNQKFTKV